MKGKFKLKYGILLLVVALTIFTGCNNKKINNTTIKKEGNMKVTSISFQNNAIIPDKYGCNTDNISPELTWSEFPPETKSFTLVCHDPDSPNGNFMHWIVANIPANVTNLSEGIMKVESATNIANDFGQIEYGGPCPGTGKHHYVFTIYALNNPKIDGINKENFNAKIKSYIIDQASITGLYQKK